MANGQKTPTTRYQKGRRWATVTLAVCGLFSMYANVRSGQLALESIIWSGFPPLVLFLTVHVISYLSPRSRVSKGLVYGGLGFVVLVAFGGSAYHIVEQAMQHGQPWYTALTYPFIADIPSLMCAAVLAKRDVRAERAEMPQERATQPKVATQAKKTTPPKSAQSPKATKPAQTAKPVAKAPQVSKAAHNEEIFSDPLEAEMLNA